MDAAEDWVPSAVTYAGNIVRSIVNGFLLETAPAMQYWKTSMTQCRTSTMMKTFAKTARMFATTPA